MDSFAERLIAWYRRHGRHDLPWQRRPTPYRVWVSEVMLQQTQVATVIPYFERFTARFPDLPSLAGGDLDEVLGLWSGLGYYSRARNLHACARRVVAEHAGELPAERDALAALPGIGRSTAAAILALAHGHSEAILDGNVKRVLCRYHAVEGWPGSGPVQKRLWELAEAHTPAEQTGEYTQAIMDLGATLCTRSRPRCDDCPQTPGCQALALGEPGRYPAPKPRRHQPVRSASFLVLRDGPAVLLERRPPSGIWGGLWCLPECPSGADVMDWCRERLGVEVGPIRPGEPFRHTFSHFHLDITPLHAEAAGPARGRIMEPGDSVWYKPESFHQLGLPAPVRRLLAALDNRTTEHHR